jgi:thiamine-phosphate pyrophosphorylase
VAAVVAAFGPRTLIIERGDGDDRARLAALQVMAAACTRHGATLMVSRRADLALAVGVGVHLPERGMTTADARRLGVTNVGRSCHAATIASVDADYALLSPVAAPLSKQVHDVLGVARFAALVRTTVVPVVALGGVVPALVPALRAAGAAGVASLGGVLAATDPVLAAAAYLSAWDEAGPGPGAAV